MCVLLTLHIFAVYNQCNFFQCNFNFYLAEFYYIINNKCDVMYSFNLAPHCVSVKPNLSISMHIISPINIFNNSNCSIVSIENS